MSRFLNDLEDLINRHSQENGSNTPDFILASYLGRCLEAFNVTMSERDKWYNREKKSESDDLAQ